MTARARSAMEREPGGGYRRNESLPRSCPDHVPAGASVFEKLLEMTLPLAVAIGIWTAVTLPWGVQV